VLALGIGEPVHDHPYRHAQKAIDAAHPFGIATGQVVVGRDEVHALAGQGVQVEGQGGDQGLALAGFHFGDAAPVQDHPADELHVEMPHVHRAPARLATNRKGLGQQAVQGCTLV
jgi:hypothetical protein